jgi:cell division protein FtsB
MESIIKSYKIKKLKKENKELKKENKELKEDNRISSEIFEDQYIQFKNRNNLNWWK